MLWDLFSCIFTLKKVNISFLCKRTKNSTTKKVKTWWYDQTVANGCSQIKTDNKTFTFQLQQNTIYKWSPRDQSDEKFVLTCLLNVLLEQYSGHVCSDIKIYIFELYYNGTLKRYYGQMILCFKWSLWTTQNGTIQLQNIWYVDIYVYVQYISWMKLISMYNTIDGMDFPLECGNESSWAILAVA